MPEDTTQENREILDRLEILENWKREREHQQISYPLDEDSLKILRQNFLYVLDIYPYFGGAAGKPFVNVIAKQDNIPVRSLSDSDGTVFGFPFNKFFVSQANFLPYSANPSDDRLTLYDELNIDSSVYANFYTNGVAPGGITAGLGIPAYKLNNVRNRSFTINDTNGNLVNITSAGTGKQFLIITDSNGVALF